MLEPKPSPVGTKLVRLADVPLDVRMLAIHRLMQYEGLTADEAQAMLDMAIDPGDRSCRIAA